MFVNKINDATTCNLEMIIIYNYITHYSFCTNIEHEIVQTAVNTNNTLKTVHIIQYTLNTLHQTKQHSLLTFPFAQIPMIAGLMDAQSMLVYNLCTDKKMNALSNTKFTTGYSSET